MTKKAYFESSKDSTASFKGFSTSVVTSNTIFFLASALPPTCAPNNSSLFPRISAVRGWYELKFGKENAHIILNIYDRK